MLISGGETTATVKGVVIGAGLQNFLSIAHSFNGAEGMYAIAADTDGIIGNWLN